MATILVIEDNELNMKLTLMLLQGAGYETLSARDAEEGLAMARHHLPRLILMDVQLPGMDGLAAMAILKADESTRGIPVIAVTALAMPGDAERILAAGCEGYIAKPLQYRALLALVANHLPLPAPLPASPS